MKEKTTVLIPDRTIPQIISILQTLGRSVRGVRLLSSGCNRFNFFATFIDDDAGQGRMNRLLAGADKSFRQLVLISHGETWEIFADNDKFEIVHVGDDLITDISVAIQRELTKQETAAVLLLKEKGV